MTKYLTNKGWRGIPNNNSKINLIETNVSNLEKTIDKVNEKSKYPIIKGNYGLSQDWWISCNQEIPKDNSHPACLFFGWADQNGNVGVGRFDSYSKEYERVILRSNVRPIGDDHNTCSITIRKNYNYMIATSAAHNKDNYLYIYRAPYGEIENFNIIKKIELDGTTSYGQSIAVGSIIIIFFRVNSTKWYYVKSEDSGLNWSDPFLLLSSNVQYYCLFRKTDNDNLIKVACYSNPGSTDSNIRGFVFNHNTGNIYDILNNDTAIANVYTGGVNKDDISIIREVQDGYSAQKLLDMSDKLPRTAFRLLVCDFNLNSNCVYKACIIGKAVNASYDICTSDLPFVGHNVYYEGGCIENQGSTTFGNVIISRNNGNNRYIERYSIDTSNTTNVVTKLCTLERELNSTTKRRLFRPFVANNKNPEMYIYSSGEFSSYTNWNETLNIGFIGLGEVSNKYIESSSNMTLSVVNYNMHTIIQGDNKADSITINKNEQLYNKDNNCKCIIVIENNCLNSNCNITYPNDVDTIVGNIDFNKINIITIYKNIAKIEN